MLCALVRIPYQVNIVGLATVVCAATITVAKLDRKILPNLATDATVVASSRNADSPDPARLVDGDIFRLAFHTQKEQNPWVLLDLGREASLEHITIYNRLDCCEGRATPMVLKISRDGQTYSQVARRDVPFVRWDVELENQRARYIRAESLANEFLHLNEIEVR